MKNINTYIELVKRLNPVKALETALKIGFFIVAIVRGLEVIKKELDKINEKQSID